MELLIHGCNRRRLTVHARHAADLWITPRCGEFDGGRVLVMEGIRSEMRDFRRATVSSFNAVREDP
jgi:hypothetical protein